MLDQLCFMKMLFLLMFLNLNWCFTFLEKKVKDLEKERFSYEHFCSLDVMSNPAPWSINGSSPENSEVSQVFDLKTQNNFPTVIKLSHYVK